MNPLVSIIMPAYNAEKYINEAINSIIKQSYKNWELLVVDDNSEDGTKSIIQKFQEQDRRIKPIFLEKNSGKPSIAKNHALKKAIGRYISFLDSDDIWLPNKLALQVKTMEINTEYGLSYTGGYWIDELGNEITKFLPRYTNGYMLKKMLLRYEINNQSVLIRKKSLDDTLSLFNENITIGEDYNLFMNVINKYPIIAINDYLIKYRIHSSAMTKKNKRVSDGILVTLSELNLYRKHPLLSIYTCLKAIRPRFFKKKWK